MTLYLASTHPDYRKRTIGVHRRNSRWEPVIKWIRVPLPVREKR